MTAGTKPETVRLTNWRLFRKKCSASTGMSPGRSRSAGVRNRPARPVTDIRERPGDQLLSGSRLTLNENCKIGPGCLADTLSQIAHHFAFADESAGRSLF